MWILLGLGCVIAFFLFWTHLQGDPATTTQGNEPKCFSTNSGPMNPTAEPPVPSNTGRSITYRLTRWDLFQNQMTAFSRNRISQGAFVVGILVLLGLVVVPNYSAPLGALLTLSLGAVLLLVVVSTVAILTAALALAFLLRHPAVICEHTMEIAERGLLERTDCNENLTRWPSICRIHSGRRFLYIYTGDLSFYAVPRRCLPSGQLAEFEAELRARASNATSSPRSSRHEGHPKSNGTASSQ